MIKWILEVFLAIICLMFIIYMCGVFHQGMFDISLWEASVRETVSTASYIGSFMILVVKLFIG